MNEKRKLKRRHLIYYLRVFDRKTNEILGHLVDITPEGVMLISEDPLPLEKDYQLRMLLPDDLLGRKHLDFDARSLWSRADVNPDFYDTGFKLHGISPDDQDIVEFLISNFGFED